MEQWRFFIRNCVQQKVNQRHQDKLICHINTFDLIFFSKMKFYLLSFFGLSHAFYHGDGKCSRPVFGRRETCSGNNRVSLVSFLKHKKPHKFPNTVVTGYFVISESLDIFLQERIDIFLFALFSWYRPKCAAP